MAQGRNGNGLITPFDGESWAKAAADCGFTVYEGKPRIGISGDTDGYIVALDVPAIDPLNCFRAYAGHALRVGQSGLKASKTPSREVAETSANSALNGGYKPARERDNDIATREAERLFQEHVAGLVRAAKPNATPDDISATVKAESEKQSGKDWIAAKRIEVLTSGAYAVTRKGGSKGSVVAVTIGS